MYSTFIQLCESFWVDKNETFWLLQLFYSIFLRDMLSSSSAPPRAFKLQLLV